MANEKFGNGAWITVKIVVPIILALLVGYVARSWTERDYTQGRVDALQAAVIVADVSISNKLESNEKEDRAIEIRVAVLESRLDEIVKILEKIDRQTR